MKLPTRQMHLTNRYCSAFTVVLAMLAFGFGVSSARAQNTVIVDIATEILEAITVNVISDLDFGTIGITTAPGFAPTLTVNTNGTVTIAGAGGGADIASLGGQGAARLGVDGPVAAAGATVNLEISNVINLSGPGASIFTLGNFTYNDQIANSGNVATGTPVAIQLGAAGDSEILIGGRLDTAAAGNYTDGTYSGSFDVIVYY